MAQIKLLSSLLPSNNIISLIIGLNVYNSRLSGSHRTQAANLSTSAHSSSEKKYQQPGIKIQKVVTPDGVIEVKKRVYQPRITLFTGDENVQIVTLEEAEKIAKRRNLKLFQTSEMDSKTQRPAYKLLNATEYLEANRKNKAPKVSGTKEPKLMTLNAKIMDNDLQSKINHIIKWLKKEQTVKVAISGEQNSAEKVFSTISEQVKDLGRIPQKVFKAGEIRFHIMLPKKPKVKTSSASDPNESLIEPTEPSKTD